MAEHYKENTSKDDKYFKQGFTTTKLILTFVCVLYFIVAIILIQATEITISKYPDYIVGMATVLAGYIAAPFGTMLVVYIKQNIVEKTLRNANMVADMVKNGDLDIQSLAVTNAITPDTGTSWTVPVTNSTPEIPKEDEG